MTAPVRRLVLRANALYIGLAGLAGMLFDIRGVLYGLGPQGRLLAQAPHAAIGFIEAHGLAVILALAFLVIPAVSSEYWLETILLPFLIFSLAALGLNILTGYAGQLSLGTGGFMACGAFAAYKLATAFPELNIVIVFALAILLFGTATRLTDALGLTQVAAPASFGLAPGTRIPVDFVLSLVALIVAGVVVTRRNRRACDVIGRLVPTP